MAKEETVKEKKKWHRHIRDDNGHGAAVYGLGFIGALVYYLQHADTLWMGVLGILKAIVWPAIVVFRVHEFFKL